MSNDTDNELAFIIGLIGLILSLLANGSQSYHTIKYKTVEGVSAIYIGAMFTLSVLFLIYSAALKLVLLLILNIGYACSTGIMAYYYKYGKKTITQDNSTQTDYHDDIQIEIR
tara:strand:- start:161 stop:499 length:339 start_codon:yes stop_codon:yes gene_type:complete